MKTNANSNTIETACAIAGKKVQAIGVNVEATLKTLDDIAVSIQCWQGVAG